MYYTRNKKDRKLNVSLETMTSENRELVINSSGISFRLYIFVNICICLCYRYVNLCNSTFCRITIKQKKNKFPHLYLDATQKNRNY